MKNMKWKIVFVKMNDKNNLMSKYRVYIMPKWVKDQGSFLQ